MAGLPAYSQGIRLVWCKFKCILNISNVFNGNPDNLHNLSFNFIFVLIFHFFLFGKPSETMNTLNLLVLFCVNIIFDKIPTGFVNGWVALDYYHCHMHHAFFASLLGSTWTLFTAACEQLHKTRICFWAKV